MNRKRILVCLGILLTLALVVHALIERVRSSPLYVAESKYSEIRPGMTMSELRGLLGDNCYWISKGSPNELHWTMVHSDRKWCIVSVIFERDSPIIPELVLIQKQNPKAEGARLTDNLNWFDRIVLYLRH